MNQKQFLYAKAIRIYLCQQVCLFQKPTYIKDLIKRRASKAIHKQKNAAGIYQYRFIHISVIRM